KGIALLIEPALKGMALLTEPALAGMALLSRTTLYLWELACRRLGRKAPPFQAKYKKERLQP
uniref:hypothetical protein n=1 Tax=Pseudomonas sp. 32_A TaxID=2813559 RepID=UPI001A9E961A